MQPHVAMFFLGSGQTCIGSGGLPYEGEVRKFSFSGGGRGGACPMRGGDFLGESLYPFACCVLKNFVKLKNIYDGVFFKKVAGLPIYLKRTSSHMFS